MTSACSHFVTKHQIRLPKQTAKEYFSSNFMKFQEIYSEDDFLDFPIPSWYTSGISIEMTIYFLSSFINYNQSEFRNSLGQAKLKGGGVFGLLLAWNMIQSRLPHNKSILSPDECSLSLLIDTGSGSHSIPYLFCKESPDTEICEWKLNQDNIFAKSDCGFYLLAFKIT